MKKIALSLISFIVLCSSVVVYAIAVDTAPAMKTNSNTSITIEWEAVEDALGYYVYYDTASGDTSGYRNEIPDLIEETEYRIEGLEASTNYYIAITAVDIEAEESSLSPELATSTTGEGNVTAFALDLVEATKQNELTLTFNAKLENTDDTEREFLILHNQTEEEVFAIETELDEDDASKLVVMLDRDLELGANYDFTILSIADENGRNIESGIDALTNFEVPVEFIIEEPKQEPEVNTETDTEPEPDLNSAGSEEVDTEPELNAGGDEEPTTSTTNNNGGNGGTIISNDDVQDITTTAEETEKLPQTGPEHILLLILALLLGSSVFLYFGLKKKS